MDTITIRYKDNASVHYDGKECAESLFKVRREKSVTGVLQIGVSVTVKTKLHVWKAVLLIVSLPQPSTQLPRAQEKGKQKPARMVRAKGVRLEECRTWMCP